MESVKQNQVQRILAYMEKHEWINPLEAQVELGVMRLTSRISNIKDMGIPIESEMVTVKNRWGEKRRVKRYRLAVE